MTTVQSPSFDSKLKPHPTKRLLKENMSEPSQTRVLIVEDDPLVSKMIQGLLEEIRCTVVGKALDGRQAIALTLSTRPDVVLMDLKLPDSDGIEATYAIHTCCPTPVVALSAYETPELIQEASAAGVGAYLIKPPSARELERAITIAIARFEDMMTLRRQAVELEALRQASLRMTASLALQPVLEMLLEQTLKLVNADDAHIFLYQKRHLEFGAALWANGPQRKPMAAPRPQGLTYTVAQSGERIVVPDMDSHPLFENSPWSGAIVGLPLCVGEQVIGVMNVAFEKPHVFDENELRLLELLAAQAAIAIQNANLYEQVQHQANQLEQKVAERTRELVEANERLRELDQLKSKFISDISHELRTPATNVRLYLQLLESGKVEKRARYLSVIEEQTDQLVRLVEDILYFSQLELNRSRIKFAPVDLNQVAEKVVATHQEHAMDTGLELIFEPETGLPLVQAQAEQIAQVVTNLVDNAVHYTSDGHVRVSTRLAAEREQACLEVQDTGPGIEPEDLPHLFERFYRGQNVGSSNIPGTGLGLSIVQEIVNLHGGKIEVESQPGQGSTFRVWLPLEQN
jgi:signal transduction histidine kinase/AmiR/NasT family two-component response regulator